MLGTLLYVFGSCKRHSELIDTDVHRLETDTKGDISIKLGRQKRISNYFI